MGSFDSAEDAAGRISLLGSVHFSGRWSVAPSARDDHWMYSERLAKAYPSIEVDASLIFIRDGNIYTSGGITTGIDLTLALVEEDLGPEVVLGVARALIVFPRRPGGQSQFRGHTSVLEKPIRLNVSELQAWMQAYAIVTFMTDGAVSTRELKGLPNAKEIFEGEPPPGTIINLGDPVRHDRYGGSRVGFASNTSLSGDHTERSMILNSLSRLPCNLLLCNPMQRLVHGYVLRRSCRQILAQAPQTVSDIARHCGNPRADLSPRALVQFAG